MYVFILGSLDEALKLVFHYTASDSSISWVNAGKDKNCLWKTGVAFVVLYCVQCNCCVVDNYS